MTDKLLQTKLYIPPIRPSLVPRTRLVEKLKAGSPGKLSLVCAPAGFGKTTLVTDWLNQLAHDHCVWLSLDEQDNDLTRFLAYFVAAIQSRRPELGKEAAGALHSPQPPPVEVVLTALINSITAVQETLVLVLDDYHLIETQPIHQALAFFLEHQPPQFHLVLITRADPLLPLSRLRARGEMTELREADLRFTLDETATFLNQVMQLGLTPAQVETLAQRTEGWIAGLQLAALSIQEREDITDFITSFSGSHRFILDYLTDEVLRRRPQGTRAFLLQTSILSRLCGPLCDAVTNQNTGRDTLARLEQANLFIIPLDELREWYRYHHLFAELLRYRLRAQDEPPEALLHQRASEWYEANGYLTDAIHHALQAQDWEKGAMLIGQVSDAMIKRGELATIQAYLARAQGDHARVIEKSQQALSLLPEDELVSRGTLVMNLGIVYWHEGRLLEAEPVLIEARDVARRTGNQYGQVASQIFLARTLASQGKLQQANAMIEQILRESGQNPVCALAHFDLSGLHYEWNELEKANEQRVLGIELNHRSGNVEFQNAGHLLQSMLLLAQGDVDGALKEVETSHTLAQNFNAATQARSAACYVQIALAAGDLETAVHWSSKVMENVGALLQSGIQDEHAGYS